MKLAKKCLCFFEDTNPDAKETAYGLLLLRISLGIVFIYHGYGKLFGDAPGLENFTGMLDGLGFPIAGVLAFLVAFAELFGGIAVLLGVFTRFSAFWLAVISLVAFIAVKGFALGMDAGTLDVATLGASLALLFMGPGAYSLSRHMKK